MFFVSYNWVECKEKALQPSNESDTHLHHYLRQGRFTAALDVHLRLLLYSVQKVAIEWTVCCLDPAIIILDVKWVLHCR